jgi:hypothetical protein
LVDAKPFWLNGSGFMLIGTPRAAARDIRAGKNPIDESM